VAGIALPPRDDILGPAESRQMGINRGLLWSVVRHDDQEIEIAIRPGFTTRLGPEQIDSNRAIVLPPPPNHLLDHFPFRELECKSVNARGTVTFLRSRTEHFKPGETIAGEGSRERTIPKRQRSNRERLAPQLATRDLVHGYRGVFEGLLNGNPIPDLLLEALNPCGSRAYMAVPSASTAHWSESLRSSHFPSVWSP
jgi:hypothetical protein